MRPRRLWPIALVLLLLSGCDDTTYERRNNEWAYDKQKFKVAQPAKFVPLKGPFARGAEGGYFRGVLIDGSDGATFAALDDRYARDKARVYFCDTYRKGQEYYTAKHNRILVLDGADAASFRALRSGYARDASRLFYEGARVTVKDLDSFEVLTDGYTRDRINGYFNRAPVAGSDGATFAAIDGHYAKDRSGVFYSWMQPGEPNVPAVPRSVRLPGAAPDTFSVLKEGYARDAKQTYFDGKLLGKDVANFQVLDNFYATTASAVYYRGDAVVGADAATFAVIERPGEAGDAMDAHGRYLRGKRVPK